METTLSREAAKVHDLVKEIATHLDGWEYNADKNKKNADGDLSWFAYLTDGTRSIWCEIDHHKARATFKADLPSRTKRGQYVSSSREYRPEIGCSAARGAKVLAREIERRLLPDLIEAHEKAAANVAQYETHEDGKEKATETILASGFGHSPGHMEGSIYLHFPDGGPYGDAQVHSGDSCELKIRGLTPEQVVKIMQIVGEKR